MDRTLGRGRLLALAIACVAVAPVFAPARAATGTVTERGTEFVPRQIDVKTGDTVVWVYESGPNNDGHAVKFDNGPDLSPSCTRGLLGGLTGCQDRANPTVQRTFTTSGTFPYRCKIHADQGMVGVVVVRAGGHDHLHGCRHKLDVGPGDDDVVDSEGQHQQHDADDPAAGHQLDPGQVDDDHGRHHERSAAGRCARLPGR